MPPAYGAVRVRSCNQACCANFKWKYVQLCINADADRSTACVIARLDPAHTAHMTLRTVKHVLMRHDATLSIESEPGKGSAFIVQFPAVVAAAA